MQTLIHAGRVLKNDSKLREAISKVGAGLERPRGPRGLVSLFLTCASCPQYHEEGPKIFHLIVKGQHMLSRTQTQAAEPAPDPTTDAEGAPLSRLQSAPAVMSAGGSSLNERATSDAAQPETAALDADASRAAQFAAAEAQYAAMREASYSEMRGAAHTQAQFLSQQQNAYAHYYQVPTRKPPRFKPPVLSLHHVRVRRLTRRATARKPAHNMQRRPCG